MSTRKESEEDTQAMFILRVLELRGGGGNVVEKVKSAIYPHAIVDEMRAMKTEITRLNDSIDAKHNIIEELQVMVSKLEVNMDNIEQYSGRANVRIQGLHDTGADEDARAKAERSHDSVYSALVESTRSTRYAAHKCAIP